jgi:hypothetical protein
VAIPSTDASAQTAGPKAVLELRVHGVHGTSPADMLGVSTDEVVQVAGDGLTGIYRAKPGITLPGRTIPDHLAVEAYSWGALTSGVKGVFGWVKRALWLLLLPFAMANLAYWARLGLGEDTRTARWGARAVRVSALILTIFLVLTACVVAIDMVAWQCFRGASEGCPVLPGQLDFLVGMSAPRRMAIASVVPLLLLVVLWLLSHQSLMRYEDVTADEEGMGGHDAPILRQSTMWKGLARTHRLQRLHLTVGMGTVVVFSGLHVLHTGLEGSASIRDWPYTWVLLDVVLTIGLAVIAIAVACVIHPDDVEYRDEGWMDRRLPQRIGGLIASAQVAVLLSHLLALFLPAYADLKQTGDFFGHNVWFIGVFVALTALHLSVFVGGRMRPAAAVLVVTFVVVMAGFAIRLHSSFGGRFLAVAAVVVFLFWASLTFWHFRIADRRPSIAWRGAGASVMLASAAWISLLFASSLTIAGANYLNGPDSVSDLVSTLPNELPSEEASRKHWTASGPITVRDGVLTVTAQGTVTVTSGVIEVDELTQTSSDVPRRGRVLLGGGIFRKGDQGDVTSHSTRILLQHSCLVDVKTRTTTQVEEAQARVDEATVGRCSAEHDTFLNAGALPLSGDTLTVDASSERVLLEVRNPAPKPLVVPQVLIWTPIMQLLWLVLVAGAIAICLSRFTKRVKPRLADLTDDWVSAHDRDAVLKRRTSAALSHRAETLLDVVGSVTAPVALALIVLSSSGRAPWQSGHLLSWTTHIATPSMYLVLAMSAGLVLLGSRLRTSEKTRQAVGVIWDLTTFWPRAAHPLAPPCYAERVVPDLRTRVDWALKASAPTNGVVILSGHSQGSLIVASVASRLSSDDLERIRIITYGSQVRALYGRIFPQVAGPEAIGYRPMARTELGNPFPDIPASTEDPQTPPDHSLIHRLRRRGGSWVNLFRRTDPLGWRVFGDVDGDDDRVTAEVPPPDAGDPGPQVMGHSDYQHTAEYIAVVDAWVHGEPVAPADALVRSAPGIT